MTQIGVRELKNRLSEFLRLVRTGERVQITDRGKVVAELSPPPVQGRDAAAGLALLEQRGLIRPPEKSGRTRYRRMPRVAPPGTAQRVLDEERGDR